MFVLPSYRTSSAFKCMTLSVLVYTHTHIHTPSHTHSHTPFLVPPPPRSTPSLMGADAGPNEAGPLTSRDLYELWTDPSGLSCTDLRRSNENNEQRGSGSCPTGPHCTMGHRTARAQGALITSLLTLQGEMEHKGRGRTEGRGKVER